MLEIRKIRWRVVVVNNMKPPSVPHNPIHSCMYVSKRPQLVQGERISGRTVHILLLAPVHLNSPALKCWEI